MKVNNSLKSLMALTLVFVLAACQTPSDSSPKESTQPSESTAVHEHEYANEWSKDETHHWKAVTCGHEEAETKIEHTYGEPVEVVEGLTGTRTWTCSECKYEKVVAITNLVINYKLPDGTLIDSISQEVKQGETYSVASPKVRFMAPSIETVEGTMDADGETIDVTYDYSSLAAETEVSPGRDMGKLYVDSKKGLSLSYVMRGSTGDWEQVFQGNTFAIYNGCIRVRDANPAKQFAGDWYDGNNSVNGAGWNALLSSDTEEILVTWSFNPDGSICVYKNGSMVFLFAASTPANGKWSASGQNYNLMVSNVTESFFAEVADRGLQLGAFVDNGSTPVNWKMRDLSVNYAMDNAAAAEYAAQYKVVKGVYVDAASNTPIRNPYVSLSKIGSTYAIPAFEVPGYIATTDTVTGEVTAETGKVKVAYNRVGEERLTESVTRDRRNEGGWNDPSYWVNMSTLTEGSVVTVEYIVNANNNNVDAWKCPIVVVYDTNNNANRCTHRFDWFGWEDGELAASQNNGSMWCGSMEEYYAVAQDCTVRATYQLVGGNLTETYTITANSGAYAGKSYFWHPSVIGIAAESVTVALAPEFAQVILTSVYY